MRALFVLGARDRQYRHVRKISTGHSSSLNDRISSRPNVIRVNLYDIDISAEAELARMDPSEKKRRAAEASLEFIQPGMIVGVGTGSTVNLLIDMLPTVRDRIDRLLSSSAETSALLKKRDFEVSTLNDVGDFDVYIDGADEATKHLQLIKGGGGALTREKVLAGAARRFVCIVDDSKLVGMLGTFPLPIEVLPMAQAFIARKLVKLRGQPVWREGVVTDNGNHILDVRGLLIANPLEMENRLNQIPGVLTVGIFAQRPADVLLIAGDSGVREMRV